MLLSHKFSYCLIAIKGEKGKPRSRYERMKVATRVKARQEIQAIKGPAELLNQKKTVNKSASYLYLLLRNCAEHCYPYSVFLRQGQLLCHS